MCQFLTYLSNCFHMKNSAFVDNILCSSVQVFHLLTCLESHQCLYLQLTLFTHNFLLKQRQGTRTTPHLPLQAFR